MTGNVVSILSSQAEDPAQMSLFPLEPSPETHLYRARTVTMLLRYLQASVELGRVPSLLGKEFFRARVTSYRMHNFEDAVIFAYDMEKCLGRLDEFSRQVLAHTVLEEYTQAETACLMRVARKTIERAYPDSLDRLAAILIDCGLMKRTALNEVGQASSDDRDRLRKKPVGRIFACQVGENGHLGTSAWEISR